jgi:hypothetical protein
VLAHAREDTSPEERERGVLHSILRTRLAGFVAERERQGAPLPRFVLEELEGYLQCGVLAFGCAHFECEGCGAVRVTALSCKGRGFCPRCCGRRMSERARHLAERVLPEVRVRQWVLSLPFGLRVRAAFDHRLALELGRLLSRAIEARYRRLARRAGLGAPRSGSVIAMQRFGSDLRLNLHYHVLFLDGAYGSDERGQRKFFTAPAPSPAQVAQVLAKIVRRASARLTEHEPLEDDELALAQSHQAASAAQDQRQHAPERSSGESPWPAGRRKARIDGWDLDAEVAVKAHERDRLQYLCRYILRPPIALERIKLIGEHLIALELKRPWRDGSTHVTMSPTTFLGRLASLVPRPRAHTLLYTGVLAAHAKDRARITPECERPRHLDASWAALMKHSFGLDVLSCRRCKARMRLVAVILDRAEVQRLLVHLRMWSDPLPISRARAPPEHEELDFP